VSKAYMQLRSRKLFLDPETGRQAPRTFLSLSDFPFPSSVVSQPIAMKRFTHVNDSILHQATVAECVFRLANFSFSTLMLLVGSFLL